SYGIFVRGHKVLGVEFAGGETITLNVNKDQKPEVDKIREVAQRVTGTEVLVAYQHNPSTGLDTLRVTARTPEKGGGEEVGNKIFQELKKEFPQAGFGGQSDKPASTERVGP